MDTKRLEQQANKLFENVAGWESSALQRIAKRIGTYGKLSLSDVKTINNIAVVKQDMNYIVEELAHMTRLNVAEVQQMYSDLIEEQHLENKPLYDYRGKTFVPFEKNTELQALARAYARTTGGVMVNLANTAARSIGTIDKKGQFVPMSKFYSDALDKAIIQISTGAGNFHAAMRDTIEALGGNGMRIDYGNGYTRRLDSFVRQSVLWGAKQASVEYNNMIGEELGCDGIEIDWHSFPRPSHEFMQGKQYCTEGTKTINGVKFIGFYDADPNSDKNKSASDALGEYGCLHFPTPIICGISEPRYSSSELKRLNEQNHRTFEIDGKSYTGYEASQAMRRLETAIREQKSIKNTALAEGHLVPTVRECDAKIKEYQAKYNEISDITGIAKDSKRMSVSKSGNKTQTFNIINTSQNFKSVVLDDNSTLSISRGNIKIDAKKLTNTINDIYLSNKVSLKPKQQHTIDGSITKAKNILGITEKPNQASIIIVHSSEMNAGVIASYNSVDNILRIVSDLGETTKIKFLQQDGVLPNNSLSTYVHELYHWKDAQEYNEKVEKITKNSYEKYLHYLDDKSKKNIDKLYLKGYNVSSISKYARAKLIMQEYDEVYTEYRTLKVLEVKG